MTGIEPGLNKNALSIFESPQLERQGFQWSEAVSPLSGILFSPIEGYCYRRFRDRTTGQGGDCIAALVSKERLFDVFLELIDILGNEVTVVLENSYGYDGDEHVDLYRRGIEAIVLKSALFEFEDLLLRDGFTGIAVLSPKLMMEVQWDEHKSFVCYGSQLKKFSEVLNGCLVERVEKQQLVLDVPHSHFSSESHKDEFERMCGIIGVDDF